MPLPSCNDVTEYNLLIVVHFIASFVFTATCFSNVAVMGSLGVRPSVRLSVCNVGGL